MVIFIIVLSEFNQYEAPLMNAHVTFPSDRILLPRGLVGRPAVPCTPLTRQTGEWQPPADLQPCVPVKRFKFGIGANVIFGGMLGVVLDHSASWFGNQIYVIQILGESYGRRIRYVMGAENLTRASRTFPIPAA
jgi:hypothetical protein